MLRGCFITFEGGEGSGKTTQARLLAHRLEERPDVSGVVLTHEPAATEAGRRIWDLIAKGGLDPVAELLLFLADRAQHVAEVIRPALSGGQVVVCDRFSDSTVAYQGYGRRLDRRLIRRLTRAATGGLKPDLTILLDLPVELGLDRQGKAADAIGREDREFHERVRRGYLEMASRDRDRWAFLDSLRPENEVAEEVWRQVEPLLERAAGAGADVTWTPRSSLRG